MALVTLRRVEGSVRCEIEGATRKQTVLTFSVSQNGRLSNWSAMSSAAGTRAKATAVVDGGPRTRYTHTSGNCVRSDGNSMFFATSVLFHVTLPLIFFAKGNSSLCTPTDTITFISGDEVNVGICAARRVNRDHYWFRASRRTSEPRITAARSWYFAMVGYMDGRIVKRKSRV